MQNGSEYCPDCNGATSPSPMDVRCPPHEIARLRRDYQTVRDETAAAIRDISKQAALSAFISGATEAFKLAGDSADIASLRAHALREKREADLRAVAEQAVRAQAARRGRA